MVVLLYPDISNFTFKNVKYLIDFLDELGNFKQKKFTLQNVNFCYILQQRTQYLHNIINYLVLSEQLGLFVKLLVTTYISSLVQYAGLFT